MMSVNRGNAFSAPTLSEHMAASLPKEPAPQLRNPSDAIALLSHACMLAAGFRLVGLGEHRKIGRYSWYQMLAQLAHQRLSPDTPSTNSTKPPTFHSFSNTALEPPNDTATPQALPADWNASQSSDYAFRYAHGQSSLHYLLKVSRLGSKAVINGLAIEDEKVHTLDLISKDFVSESSLPYNVPANLSSPESNENETALSLQKVFISAGRITDAANLLKIQIIQKLAPGLHKEGYEDSAHTTSNTEASQDRRDPRRQPEGPPAYDPLREDHLPPRAQPRPFDDPLADVPRRPFPAGDFPPPGFEDEYEINRPPGGIGGGPARRPLNIGERDLYPPGLGPHDPLRIGGGGFPGGGGMHPTFDDPMFGGGGGAGGYDPRAPPGARYDPIGPGDGPPMGRGPRFPGGGMGGRPPNPFGGFGGNDFI